MIHESKFDPLKIQLIKKSTYQNMPWKNGQGTTAQIALNPPEVRFPEDPFLWRLSSASIQAANSFSTFPGYDRLLLVWQGQGLRLNDKILYPDQGYFFSGETPIFCELLDDPVVDLGIIYDRAKIAVEIQTLSFTKKDGPLNLSLKPSLHFLFCAAGSFKIQNLWVHTGDTLRIERGFEIEILPEDSGKLYHFCIDIKS